MVSISRTSRQLGQRFSQINPGIDSELLIGGGVTFRALISFSTRKPFHPNKISYLRASTKNASQLCLTNLFCLNS